MLFGLMEKNILDNIAKIKKKVKERLNGQMGKNILEVGMKGNNMEKDIL